MDLPAQGAAEEELAQRLTQARGKDTPFLSGHVIGSMCTAPHPAGLEAWRLFADTNLGDPLINPGAAELADEVVAMLASLLGGGPESGGLFLSGGTEANIVAVRLARDTTHRNEIVLPATAHFSFHKAAHALGMDVTTLPLTDTFEVDVEAAQEVIGPQTACVVGVAGNTEFGAVDDIQALAELGKDHGAWVHVDAAYGGLVLPFLEDPVPFGLDVDGVDSVTVDPHKMGRAPIPAGALVVADEATLQAGAIETPYVSTERQAGLLSSRPGAAAAGAWAALNALGRRGLATQAEGSVYLAKWLARTLSEKGLALVRDPPGLGIVAIEAEENQRVRAQLAERGWIVSLTTIVPGIRVVCMPHVTAEHLTTFSRVLPRILEGEDGRLLHA